MNFFWITVAWHRFIHLDEVPSSVLPTFRGGHVLTYAGNRLLVGLASLPVVIGAAVLLGIITAMGTMSTGDACQPGCRQREQ